jgi:hypothetical protein
MGTTSVDPAILHAAAQRIDTAAEIVQDAVKLRLQFGGSVAGRSHASAGGAVRTAVEQVVADLQQWASTAREAAAALRAGADRHSAADAHAATTLL